MLELVSFRLETQADKTIYVRECSSQEESETEGKGANRKERHRCLCYKVYIVVIFQNIALFIVNAESLNSDAFFMLTNLFLEKRVL
jgi:hypothetical protein